MPPPLVSAALMFVALTACSSSPRATVAAPPQRGLPFGISSTESNYALVGTFSGTVDLVGDSAIVHLAEGVVRSAVSREAFHDVRVAAAIGTATGRSWTTRATSEAQLVRAEMTAGEAAQLGGTTYIIRDLGRLDPSHDWLVFIIAARDDVVGAFTTYACAATASLPTPDSSDDRPALLRASYERKC